MTTTTLSADFRTASAALAATIRDAAAALQTAADDDLAAALTELSAARDAALARMKAAAESTRTVFTALSADVAALTASLSADLFGDATPSTQAQVPTTADAVDAQWEHHCRQYNPAPATTAEPPLPTPEQMKATCGDGERVTTTDEDEADLAAFSARWQAGQTAPVVHGSLTAPQVREMFAAIDRAGEQVAMNRADAEELDAPAVHVPPPTAKAMLDGLNEATRDALALEAEETATVAANGSIETPPMTADEGRKAADADGPAGEAAPKCAGNESCSCGSPSCPAQQAEPAKKPRGKRRR